MKVNFAKISPFHVDPERVEGLNLLPEDFNVASDDEKESVVYKHKSTSYWRDAARRFRRNTVSMAALFVFILCLLFAFLGPHLIPYNYSDQYRSSQKLSSMQYSEDEQQVIALSQHVDAFFATSLQPGSLTAIKKGDYFINFGGRTYAFTLTKAIEKSVLALDADAADPLFVVKMKDIEEDGAWKDSAPVELSDAPAEGAQEIRLITGVFPHVFGTDSSGRDLMARTMYGAQVSIIIGIAAAIIVLIIGSIYGSISGLAGGKVDFVMMRIVELIYSIPEVLIVLLLQVVLTDPLRTWFDSHKTGIGGILGDLGPGIVSIFITHGPHRARPGAATEKAGIRHRRHGPGRFQGPDHPPASAAQRRGRAGDHHLPADPLGHLLRVVPVLPGPGRLRADGQPGLAVLRRPGHH